MAGFQLVGNMGLGTSFAFIFLGIAGSKMEAEESKKVMLNTFALSRMGQIGLTLLVISGIYLIMPHWQNLPDTPLLIVKLILVLVLGALMGISGATAKKVKAGDMSQMKKLQILGRISMLTALTIVALAIFIFK